MKKLNRLRIAVAFSIYILSAVSCSKIYSPEPSSIKPHDSLKSEQSQSETQNIYGENKLCVKHQIPAAVCSFCDPKLREAGRLWCKEHERYEDRCFICHPELKEANRIWCEEHKLYEDECIFCHPDISIPHIKNKKKAAGKASKTKVSTVSSKELLCSEHDVNENECGICHPELLDKLQVGQGLKIRLESAESAVKSGIVTSRPTKKYSRADITVLCQVSYNQNSLVHIAPLASGVIRKVLADVGNIVAKGQALVEIISPEIARAENAYLTALENEALMELVYNREKILFDKSISSRQEYEQSLNEFRMAKNTTAMLHQELLNYGLSKGQIREGDENRHNSSLLLVASPFSGTLIDRNAVDGQAVNTGDMIFTLADLSTMWLELSISEGHLSSFSVGDEVEAVFDALPGNKITGRLIWLSSSVDKLNRMIIARAIVPNPNALLKNGMFGQVRLLPNNNLNATAKGKGLFIPASAIHRFNGNPFVFVKLAQDLYQIRRVLTGGKQNELIEILKGVSAQEAVAYVHSFTLKSEFLKSRLGAGCADE